MKEFVLERTSLFSQEYSISDKRKFQAAHEIMALFVFRNLILQSRMHSHPVGLDV